MKQTRLELDAGHLHRAWSPPPVILAAAGTQMTTWNGVDRQLRNKDAALRSRERKKMYVKELEMKSRYYGGECRRLGSLLQCFMTENQALRVFFGIPAVGFPALLGGHSLSANPHCFGWMLIFLSAYQKIGLGNQKLTGDEDDDRRRRT